MVEKVKHQRLRWLREWVVPIAVGLILAFSIKTWVVTTNVVPSSSMYPTIPNPCYILVDHVATETQAPYRGEVVLFPFPDDPSQIYVKRIIGMPGETVTIHGGHVYINHHELSEPYLHGVLTPGTWGPYHVPAGHYFMLGDNRAVSDDSRYWIHKYVARNTIIGRADFVVWPVSKWTPIH